MREQIIELVEQEKLGYRSAGVPVTCSKGCSACCAQQISVTKKEVQTIIDSGVDIDMERLSSQNENWEESDKTCVFLKHNLCSIYDIRPMKCIHYMVNTPPDRCMTKKPVNFIITKHANDIIKKELKDRVVLHEELYRCLQ